MNRNKHSVIAGVLLAAMLGGLSGCMQIKTVPDSRQPHWAQPVPQSGVRNLYQVSPDLYRGKQPTQEGFRQLAGMGVRTIVSLRITPLDPNTLDGTDLNYEQINMWPWGIRDKEVVRFLQVVTDPRRKPVFVYCYSGADRTGLMCAAYRVVVQGWSKEEALAEMRTGGFGYHAVWSGLVKYLLEMDVQEIRRQVGLPAGTS